MCDTANVVFFLGISLTSSLWVVAKFLRHPVHEESQIFCQTQVSEWLQNFCNTQCIIGRRISATPWVWSWMVAEFLLHPVYECGRRISATSSVWVVAEFLQHPVYESLQNFCYIHCMKGRRISATASVWVVANFCNIQCKSAYTISAELLVHPVYERLQNFCDTHCMGGRKISATSSVWVTFTTIDLLSFPGQLVDWA